MIRLLHIEFLKLRPYKPFWILSGLYAIIIVGMGLGSHGVVDWMSEQGANFQGILPSAMPIFDFDDLWQNLTFMGRFFFPVLAFLIVISINNEFSFNTMKQNVIDGMSKAEWLMSKVLLLLLVSVIAGLLHLFVGLYLGYQYSSVTEWDLVVKNISFVAAFTLQLMAFLSLGLLLTILIRKAILSFGILLILYFPLELIIRWLLPDVLDATHQFFPIKAILNIIDNPFPKYIFMDVNTHVNTSSVAILVAHVLGYWGLSFWILKKRDM